MGLFGNLFEKKICSVCGGEIGLLGNRKLEDGNLCKNCAKNFLRGSATDGTPPWMKSKSSLPIVKQTLNK